MREKIAKLAHEQWSGWMDCLFSKCREMRPSDGEAFHKECLIIPEWAVKRWTEQAETAYCDLSEKEKDSDRAEADKFLEIFQAEIDKQSIEHLEIQQFTERELTKQIDELQVELDEANEQIELIEKQCQKNGKSAADRFMEIDRFKAELDKHREQEAMLCPEDVGFVEYTKVLQNTNKQLQADLKDKAKEEIQALIEKYGDPQYKTNEFALYDTISIAQQLLAELDRKDKCINRVITILPLAKTTYVIHELEQALRSPEPVEGKGGVK